MSTRALCLLLALSAAVGNARAAEPPSPANPSAAATTPAAIGESFTLDSKALAETRRINVYLPKAYLADPTRRLPVLYMPDGGMGEDFPHVAGLLQVLIDNGSIRPMLLVGIENTQRRRDLTGPTEVAEDRKIAPVVGGSAAFRAFLSDELFAEIARRYRVDEHRSIIGESLAGLFVVECYIESPRLFDAYLAFDPSLWWNHGHLVERAKETATDSHRDGRRLWLAHSNEPDLAASAWQLFGALTREPSPARKVSLHPFANESHATIYHPAALAALREVFAP